ncbi:MAG: hypothetical protein WCS74_01410 [Dehalococcoidales bacterium]|jgi:hypothetical protein
MDEIPDIFEMLQDVTIPSNPVFEKYMNCSKSFFTWRDMLENPNGWIFYQSAAAAQGLDPDKSKYHMGFVNMLKILSYWFDVSPYYNSRLGWWLWRLVSHTPKESYYPLRYALHYDPELWYMPGEEVRPPSAFEVDPDDPLRIGKPQAKGKDAFIMRI